jgi:hypothetical protein
VALTRGLEVVTSAVDEEDATDTSAAAASLEVAITLLDV